MWSHMYAFRTHCISYCVSTAERHYSRFANTLATNVEGITVRVQVTSDAAADESSCRLSTTEPPPPYDVAVIYNGYQLQPVSADPACYSQVREFICHEKLRVSVNMGRLPGRRTSYWLPISGVFRISVRRGLSKRGL